MTLETCLTCGHIFANHYDHRMVRCWHRGCECPGWMTPTTRPALTEPATEAGRALLLRMERYEAWHTYDGRRDRMLADILRIEAEAVQRNRALATALGIALNHTDKGFSCDCWHEMARKALAAQPDAQEAP